CRSSQSFCSGWSLLADKPSMVVTFLPATIATGVWHERIALPSRCTVQAPHMPAPQPYFVPVSLRCSRTTESSGVAGPASTVAGLLLTVKVIVITHSRMQKGLREYSGFPAGIHVQMSGNYGAWDRNVRARKEFIADADQSDRRRPD